MCRNYGKGEKWVPGIVTKKLSSVTILVSTNSYGVWKRHTNQIIERIIPRQNISSALGR